MERVLAQEVSGSQWEQASLPATFGGSDRALHQCYLDAMAMVRVKGKPDYFITMTANPNWPEVTEKLLPGQAPSDRPDLAARVFYQ